MQKIVIIGGGAIGLSLAYHLSLQGTVDVTVLERNSLTSGTSWHAAGIVGPLRASASMTQLAMYATQLFPRLEQETGMSTGYRRTGGYWLARDPARMDELHRIANLGRHFGLTPSIISPEQVQIPGLNRAGLVGAMRVEEDANVNPVDLCMAYARAARGRGVVIREGVQVSDLIVEQGRAAGVRMADGSTIRADAVALCAGAWSRRLAERAGVALPLQAVEHMYIVTEPMPQLPNPFPVLRDLDRGIYIKGDAGKLVIGGFEPDAKCWDAFGPEGDRPFLELPEDWDQFTPFLQAALALLPDLEKTGIQHFMNGPESFTADTRPLIGEAPALPGLFVAAGMNSVGIMSSAGVGRALAGWMVAGHAPSDLWAVDVARADPLTATDAHLAVRMVEAVADTFAMHWPFKQPKAGRGLRKSALHDRWAAQGAHFGLTAGWERGLWYAANQAERELPYSTGAQPWFPIVQREAAQMATGAVLIDLSPFGKFDVAGPDAPALMEWLATARMDMPPGRVAYSLMLNERGGIEADVTVSRLSPDHYRITSGAATRWHDLAWLRRHAAGRDVRVADSTEAECVIGLMGAVARRMLQAVSPDDWQDFPYGATAAVTIAGIPCRATRVSYVGELGWELSVPADRSGGVFDALIAQGAAPMGHFALDACRIEKGFRHWGHDLGPTLTPLETGLGFALAWDKEFIGKPALAAQRAAGPQQRMVLFDLPDHPLILHDELIMEDGRVVGLTTSGARGARTGMTLALGLVDIAPGETLAQTCARRFAVQVADRLCPATPLLRPPYDPTNERMKS